MDDVDEDEKDAERHLAVLAPHVVNAVADLGGAVCLLAACICAVHPAFITELDGEEEAALVDPILLSLLDCILVERLVAPVPVSGHLRHVVEDLSF